MAELTLQQVKPFTINIPKVDIKRFKGLAKAMGWTYEEVRDVLFICGKCGTFYRQNPKIL